MHGAQSSSRNGNMVRVYEKSLAEHSKLRLLTKNIFLNFDLLFQQLLLPPVTNIKDPWLEFLEKDQTHHIVKKRELQQVISDDDKTFQFWLFSLSDFIENNPAYWRSKVLDAQAILSKKYLHLLFITTAMHYWSQNSGCVRLGAQHGRGIKFVPADDNPRMFDRPSTIACGVSANLQLISEYI